MSITLSALGCLLTLQIDDDDLRSAVSELTRDLRLCSAEAGGADTPERAIEVSGTGPWVVSSPVYWNVAHTAGQALGTLLTAVNLTAVDTSPHLAFHAAVVERHGQALVIPAPSGEGKTTLTAALFRYGWRYVSDEALCLRASDGAVLRYPRPLALSPWSAGVLGRPQGIDGDGETWVSPGQLHGALTQGVDAVGHIVVLTRDGSEPRLDVIHKVDAVTALLRRGFNHFRDPERALRLAADLCGRATTWQLHLGDPMTAAALLTTELRT